MGVGTGSCVIHALSGDVSMRWLPVGQAVVAAKAALDIAVMKRDEMDSVRRNNKQRLNSLNGKPLLYSRCAFV